MESSSAQGLSTITVHLKLNYDTNAALTQIQAKVAQVRNDLPPEAEAPDHRAGDRGQPVRGHVPRLLLRRPRPEPDHRLPDPRGAAQALRHQRRAAGRHPGRPHLRHAHLAEAGQDGRPGHLALRRCSEALAQQQLPLGPGPDQGLDGVRQPGGQHRPQARRRSSASSWSRRRRASWSAWARSPTWCSAPRTTTRTSASTARPPPSWASGCCPPPTRST